MRDAYHEILINIVWKLLEEFELHCLRSSRFLETRSMRHAYEVDVLPERRLWCHRHRVRPDRGFGEQWHSLMKSPRWACAGRPGVW